MLMARDYVEGWCDGIKYAARVANEQAESDDNARQEYDGGSGSMGYRLACAEIECALNKQVSE
jgi:hypothetical protein